MTTTSDDERPYWFPQLTDDAWIARVRADYPAKTEGMSDEWVRDTYAGGYKYADTWDHLGEARHYFEKLADAYLALLATPERRPAVDSDNTCKLTECQGRPRCGTCLAMDSDRTPLELCQPEGLMFDAFGEPRTRS